MVTGVPQSVLIEAAKQLLGMPAYQVGLLAAGVSVVLLFSVLYIWKHASNRKGADV